MSHNKYEVKGASGGPPNTAAMEEEIRKLLYGLPLDEQIIAIKNKMEELEEFKREIILKE